MIFHHFIYTRQDQAGWGLLDTAPDTPDRDAVEAICRSMPASEDGPLYALIYSPALHGLTLCASTVCESGSDHRGRCIVHALVADDRQARANPALAALPALHLILDCALPSEASGTEDFAVPAPPTPDTLVHHLHCLGLSPDQLPALLFFLYRALPRQNAVFSLPIASDCTPADALYSLAELLSWVTPPALMGSCTLGTGAESTGNLRFLLSRQADSTLPEPSDPASVFFYTHAADGLRTDPAGYQQFLQDFVLCVLPGMTPSWQTYPFLYLLSYLESNGSACLQDPDICAIYTPQIDLFFSYQTQYPALRDRLHALLCALAEHLTAQPDVYAALLARLTAAGDAAAFAALPDGLRTDAARLWIERTLSDCPDKRAALTRCQDALSYLPEPERRSLWKTQFSPVLVTGSLPDYIAALQRFVLADPTPWFQDGLQAALHRIFIPDWHLHPENRRKLTTLAQAASKCGLSAWFDQQITHQIDRLFADPSDRRLRYSACQQILWDLLPAVGKHLERYKPPEPVVSTPAGTTPPVQAPSAAPSAPAQAPQDLEQWLAQYNQLTASLRHLLMHQQTRLPESFSRDPALQQMVREAAMRIGLTKKQLRELLGWWGSLF